MTRVRRDAVRILLLLTACAPAAADVVRLRNGGELEGLVLSETPAEVVLSIGAGSITLRREAIASVEQGGEEDNARIRTAWEEAYFATPRFAPETLRPLAASFLALESSRRAAVAAVGRIARAEERAAHLRDELATLHPQLEEAARALQRATPDADALAYNRKVARSNALSARVSSLHDQVRRAAEEIGQQRRAAADYLGRLEAFETRVREAEARQAEAPADSGEAVFLARLRKGLKPLSREVATETVSYEQRENQLIVVARVNGMADARLLLDTGAEMVAVSEGLAARLGLSLSTAPDITLRLAGGGTMGARRAVLKRIEVHGMALDDVPAIVLPASDDDGLDGLLGMSFLGAFQFQIDPVGRQLILRRFQPE